MRSTLKQRNIFLNKNIFYIGLECLYFLSQNYSSFIIFDQHQKQMKITITDGSQVANFDVESDQPVEDIKALIQAQMGVPFERSQLYFNGKLLHNNAKLNSTGIQQGGLLFLTISNFQQTKKTQPKKTGGLGLADMIKNFDKQAKQNPHQFHFMKRNPSQFQPQAQRLIDQLKGDPFRLQEVGVSNPQIAKAIQKGDSKQLAKILHKKHAQKLKKISDEQKKFRELSKDPMNAEYQRMLQQRIHQENIDKNLQFANQYIPEVFGHIHMLYINAKINKNPIQAFVDSGAQSTIMSESLAERCGLMRLVDKRQAGRAVGVGSCKILGKIHAADIQIEGKFITCSFTVIENNSVQFLLGLDMLKRFSCLIDLKKNVLDFQDGMIVTKFLSDGQIQKNSQPAKKEDIQPKLKKLMEMGFTKEQSISALQSCNYNQEVAGNMLMQRKYGQ